MDLESLKAVLSNNDGSLPDINFNFGGTRVVADAYALVQRHATSLTSIGSYYWSKTKEKECPISFGENPAELVVSGVAEPFHVVFGGLVSKTGHKIPDLGFFVLGEDFVALDYRMGPEWSLAAIEGLLSLMEEIASLAPDTSVVHESNVFDPNGKILMQAFSEWRAANKRVQATCETHAPEAWR
ncbi:hypothetical protein [Rhodoferax sp. U11-2br]|uniref:hypothetical protein n=1 Tax=Rhodoferax sp. U11-2br TaxID=2838878 RepID=UPI001BE52BF5|nr:hypothetical protein [Rhodoferax sp. U11-2br]MBT3068771.1 hypothetical protein [Rhodoferax sp. U11-2br]